MKLDVTGTLRGLKPTTRDGRDRLISKLVFAIDTIVQLSSFNAAANANLTSVQARCTDQLEAKRELFGEVVELLNALEALQTPWKGRRGRCAAEMRVRVAASMVCQLVRYGR